MFTKSILKAFTALTSITKKGPVNSDFKLKQIADFVTSSKRSLICERIILIFNSNMNII